MKKWIVALIFLSAPTWADVDTNINRAILAALHNDTTRSDTEKLFHNRCKTIRNTVGFEQDTIGDAREYSCDTPGVGIALYAVEDLGIHSPEKVGKYFVDHLNSEGVQAKVFVQRDHKHGSAMIFMIDGASWTDMAIRPSEGIAKLPAMSAESKLILLTKGRISTYPVAATDHKSGV